MKKIISILLLLVILLSVFSVSTSAADYGCDINTSTQAVYLKNLDTGNIVYEKNANEVMYPASLTKIMTYIIVAENVPDFDSTMITIEETMLTGLDPESSVMGLAQHIGESFSIKELVYGMLVASGNDAAWVLADYVGHGVDTFVDMMNKKAAQLGCTDTHFVNPHGLHNENHYTTAKDMALITEYAINKGDFLEITNTTSYTPKGYTDPVKTTNYLIDVSQKDGYYYYQYAKGIKTGYTNEAGKCLITMANKDNYSYLLIELGSPYSEIDEINYAMIDAKNLFTWSFDNIKFLPVLEESTVVETVPVKYVWGNQTIDLVADKSIEALLPIKYSQDDITTEVKCETQAYAPVKKGDALGSVTVYYKGEKLGSANLVANRDIGRSLTNFIISKLSSSVQNNLFIVIILIFIVIGIVISLIIAIRQKKAQKSRNKRRYR